MHSRHGKPMQLQLPQKRPGERRAVLRAEHAVDAAPRARNALVLVARPLLDLERREDRAARKAAALVAGADFLAVADGMAVGTYVIWGHAGRITPPAGRRNRFPAATSGLSI